MKIVSIIAFIYVFLVSGVMAATAPFHDIIIGGGPNNGSAPTTQLPAAGKNSFDIIAASGNSSQDYYMAFVSQGAIASMAQYKVTTGKEAVCTTLYVSSSTTANTQDYLQFGYGTAALAADQQVGAPTGAVCYSTTCSNLPSAQKPGTYIVISNGGGATETTLQVRIRFPADSYPFVRFGVSSKVVGIRLHCIEE